MTRYTVLLIGFWFAGIIHPLQAQHYAGAAGGIHFADLKVAIEDEDIVGVSTRNAAGIGAVLGLEMNRNFYLHLEALYLQKGGMLIQETPYPEVQIKLAFLEVPVFFKYVFGDENNVRPYLMGGPVFGYLLSSEVEFVSGGMVFTGDTKAITNQVDFGIGFGAGVSVPVDGITLFLEGRYTSGFANLNRGGTFEVRAGQATGKLHLDDNDEISTRGFQILLGVSMPIGG